jgi:hypothetical protein
MRNCLRSCGGRAMRVRFQADADLDGRVLRGLRRAEPQIDIQSAADAELTGLPDLEVLRIAADSGRILVSQDRRTMPLHFARYAAGAQSRGHSATRSDSRLYCNGRAGSRLERKRGPRVDWPARVDSTLTLCSLSN